LKGGETGQAIVPGKSAESILVRSVEGTFEKDGKRKIMPPGSKRKKLEPDEIALLKTWIVAGAKGPSGSTKRVELVTPEIPLIAPARRPINAIAFAPQSKLVAIARYGEVELQSPDAAGIQTKLGPMRGSVNAVVASPDGRHLFAAAGEAGIFGEVRQWNIADGKMVRLIEGHQDAIYSAALSPDGKVLATGSYDQKIKLWDVATGVERQTLTGHNGAVLGLAFRPDGKILASASADRTIKLWDVGKGKRTDTLPQPLKEQYAVAFSADGRKLYGGGADSRIRIWQISESAAETTNPLLESRYAHEGTILRLILSPNGQRLLSCSEDRSLKVWDTAGLKQRRVFDKQPDWISAAAFLADDRIAVGRMDGSLDIYNVNTGEALTPPMIKAEVQ
jgi:WD40 repeat protein